MTRNEFETIITGCGFGMKLWCLWLQRKKSDVDGCMIVLNENRYREDKRSHVKTKLSLQWDSLTDKKVIFQATFMFLLCELKLLWKNIKILYYRG